MSRKPYTRKIEYITQIILQLNLLLSNNPWKMCSEICNKFAIITGGAAGIGTTYCDELLKNNLGGIVIADIDEANGKLASSILNKTYGANKAIFIKTDVTKADQLEAAFKLAMSTFGRIDIVINNAGIMNDENWQLEIAINCSAVVQGSLFGIQYMGKNNGGKGGVIVNIASILGLQELEGCPIYVGTKHFVVGLDRSFGTDYYFNLTGIKFLTMCPGVTDTPLISQAGVRCLKDFPNLGKVLTDGLGVLPPQKAENVAKGMITLITKGKNGSVWIAEGGLPIYEVEIPNRTTLKKE